MSAAFIMLTSLLPSPIARAVLFRYLSFIINTILAFCFGDTLVAITDSALSQRSKSLYWRNSDSWILFSVAPVTMSVKLFWVASSRSLIEVKALFSYFLILIKFLQSRVISTAPSFINPQLRPMLMAVSTLSPVIIQVLIPASRNFFSVSSTPS